MPPYWDDAFSVICKMSVKADQLKVAVHGNSIIQKTIADHLVIIDIKLKEFNRSFGPNVVKIHLPAQFGITGMNAADQQLVIYSEIIKSLQERGFTVGIQLGSKGDSSTLFVKWVTSFEKVQRDAMRSIIKKVEILDVNQNSFSTPTVAAPANGSIRRR